MVISSVGNSLYSSAMSKALASVSLYGSGSTRSLEGKVQPVRAVNALDARSSTWAQTLQKDSESARAKGAQAVVSLNSSQAAVLNSTVAYASAASNSKRVLEGQKGARRMLEDMHRSAIEASEGELAYSRKMLAQRVEKALSGEGSAEGEVQESTPSDIAVFPARTPGFASRSYEFAGSVPTGNAFAPSGNTERVDIQV